MMPIDRNPDIDLDQEEIPPGYQLIRGKNLHPIARSKRIPFGVASRLFDVDYNRRQKTRMTAGLIIRDHDVERFNAALANKNSHKKTP